jgi:hypothetical protein
VRGADPATSATPRSRSVRSRRTGRRGSVLVVLIAGALALQTYGPSIPALPGAVAAGAANASADAPAPVAVAARSADAFTDSVGVNTHLAYTDTAYGDTDRVFDLLRDLGVRHIRDSVPEDATPGQLDALARLPELGVTADVVVGSAGHKGPGLPAAADAVRPLLDSRVAAAVGAVEAPNEWDLRAPGRWTEELPPFQRQLYAAVKGAPQLAHAAVVGPSLGRREHLQQLAGLRLSADFDVHNLHLYARGDPPEDGLTGWVKKATEDDPGKPLSITEAGFHTATAQKGRQKPVSEAAQGDYELRNVLANFGAGVSSTYLYELLDEKSEPSLQDQEEHFGLVRSDLTPKPAYEQLRQLLHATADPGPATPSAAQPLTVGLPDQAGGEGIGHLLLQRRDGTYQLALWRTGSLYGDGHDVAATPTLTVGLDQARPIGVTVLDGSSAERPLGTGATLTGRLGNDVLLFDLGAPGAGAGGVVTFTAPTGPGSSTGGGTPVVAILVGVVVLVLLIGAGVAVYLRRRRPRRP